MTNEATPREVGSNAGLGAWQPIDTAPKDGTRLLGCSVIYPNQYWVFRWVPFTDPRDGLGCWSAEPDGGGVYATHWMPLPAPPQSA